jgi:hypothetical protein
MYSRFDVIIPLSNRNVYSIIINHFQWKHHIYKYDPNWHRYASVSQICKVLLMMDRDTHSTAQYEFDESVHEVTASSHPTLRKRDRVDEDEDEDENELFDAEGQVEFRS